MRHEPHRRSAELLVVTRAEDGCQYQLVLEDEHLDSLKRKQEQDENRHILNPAPLDEVPETGGVANTVKEYVTSVSIKMWCGNQFYWVQRNQNLLLFLLSLFSYYALLERERERERERGGGGGGRRIRHLKIQEMDIVFNLSHS